jgi:hypothetical protein
MGFYREAEKNSKPENYLKIAQNPTRRLHALLGNQLAYQNDGRKQTPPPTCSSFTHNLIFGNHVSTVLRQAQ